MNSGDYLERVDGGETVRVNDLYLSGDYEALVDIFENSTVTGGTLEVDSSYANDVMYDDEFDPVEKVEDGVANLLENQYEEGFNKANDKMKELNNRLSWNDVRDRALDKANKNEKKVKAATAGMGLGAVGIAGGIGLENVHLLGGGAALEVISGNRSATWQGMRERELREAAKGLNQGYANHEINIR